MFKINGKSKKLRYTISHSAILYSVYSYIYNIYHNYLISAEGRDLVPSSDICLISPDFVNASNCLFVIATIGRPPERTTRPTPGTAVWTSGTGLYGRPRRPSRFSYKTFDGPDDAGGVETGFIVKGFVTVGIPAVILPTGK